MIAIVDYDAGNPSSIKNMLAKLGVQSVISRDKNILLSASKLILPGVGHFAFGMKKLNDFSLVDILNEKVLNEKTPFLGICLGMQLMTKHSEEGDTKGLGWIDANTLKFTVDPSLNYKIPHMGWADITPSQHPLFRNYTETPRFYFVHSYYVKCNTESGSIAKTRYGVLFDSAVARDNIMGVQFHPEKSHLFGMTLLRNFSEL